jgi:hypothetical protein
MISGDFSVYFGGSVGISGGPKEAGIPDILEILVNKSHQWFIVMNDIFHHFVL